MAICGGGCQSSDFFLLRKEKREPPVSNIEIEVDHVYNMVLVLVFEDSVTHHNHNDNNSNYFSNRITQSNASMSAPFSQSRATTSEWPFSADFIRAVDSY